MSKYIVANPPEFRANVRGLIKGCFVTDTPHNQDTTKIYTNIEIAIFNYTIQKARKQNGVVVKWEIPAFVQIYADHLRTVLHNLDHTPELRTRILNGEISPKDFVFMTHQEWSPAIWETYIEEKNKKDNMRYNKTVQASTDMFVCKKCHNNKCTYFEMQTRSADESATIFVNCLTCGKNWRE
jgi:transcription elongation factor S-II